MKKRFFAALFSIISLAAGANGVAIVDAVNGIYLPLKTSLVKARVQDQVAITVAEQTFLNDLGGGIKIKYAYPMPAGASAVGLRWRVGSGAWIEADFKAEPQDPTLPGSGGGQPNDPALTVFLGAFPLFFEIKDALQKDSSLTVELSFVELLPYKNGKVTYRCPAKYTSLQAANLVQQRFEWSLVSGRKIVAADFASHPTAPKTLADHEATAFFEAFEKPAAADFEVVYQLDATDLGLFSFSVFLKDTLGCDSLGQGFCAFVVEPNPNPNADVIPKVFTLIIDRSGSMSGQKMLQAREAASFIVNNLNAGDLFNVIDFDDQITSFKPDHVPFTTANRDAALAFIAALTADGSTNISGAFSAAIPQFANDNGDTYNIVIFFTDGEPTAGITDPAQIVQHIHDLIVPLEKDLSVFTFGIGSDVNKPLLTLIANQNKGIAQFLDNNQLADAISEFYQTVRNPVLIGTSMAFAPNSVHETYPQPLPNLYKGAQMLVVGRYDQPGTVQVTFNGTAFSAPASYQYTMVLTAEDSVLMRFLPKIWAKQKAQNLLQQFYATNDTALQALLKAEIEHLSICYGIITDLTSFIDNGGGGQVAVFELPSRRGTQKTLEIIDVSPNPATERATIRVELREAFFGQIWFEVFDLLGRKVAEFSAKADGSGQIEAVWAIDPAIERGAFWIKAKSAIGSDARLILVK